MTLSASRATGAMRLQTGFHPDRCKAVGVFRLELVYTPQYMPMKPPKLRTAWATLPLILS